MIEHSFGGGVGGDLIAGRDCPGVRSEIADRK